MSGPARNVAAQAARPQATLGAFDAAAVIVGIVIGAGIFRTPSIVAANVASEAAFIWLWIAGGVISLVGALCYAELGSAHPNTGGEYHFLARAYGGRVGFLFAWARMSVVQTGAIAAVAFVFGDYASRLLSLGEKSSTLYALLAVAAITALNAIGTRRSRLVQNSLTVALALAIAVVIIAGLLAGGIASPAAAPASSGLMFSQFALIFILLTYGGWNEAAYLTGEIRDAQRNVARALVAGIVTVTVIFVLLNLAYLNVLGLDGMKGSKAVAADLMHATLGDAGATAVCIIVVAGALGTLNATIFTGARTSFALGRDFPLFGALGRWHVGANAPVNALLVQGGVTLSLVLLASLTPDGFETMVAYTAPAFWLFFMLTGVSLFLLRGQRPVHADHFRVPLYPLTPLVFCATCGFMLHASINYALSRDPGSPGAQLGIGVLLAGVPLMFLAKRRQGA